MALAECQHHSAQRPKKARAREEEREVHHTAAFRTTVRPSEPELFDLFEEPGGRRPDSLLEPEGPQPGSQARRNAHFGCLPVRADSRCAGAADGKSGGGSAAEVRHGVYG